MAVFFLVVFAIGVPAIEVAVLATRLKTLNKMFRGPEYRGRYVEDQERGAADATEGRQSGGEVKTSEWQRYLTADDTQLAGLYESFAMKWIYMAPLLLFFKVVLLVPVVFTEPESLLQLALMATAECLYFFFVFLTDPYLSHVTALTVRVGSIHQLLIVGMVSLHMVEVFNGNREGLTSVMIATSACYLAFVVVELALLQIIPIVMQKRSAKILKGTLDRLGILPAKSSTLFLRTTGEAVRRLDVLPVTNVSKRGASQPPYGLGIDDDLTKKAAGEQAASTSSGDDKARPSPLDSNAPPTAAKSRYAPTLGDEDPPADDVNQSEYASCLYPGI